MTDKMAEDTLLYYQKYIEWEKKFDFSGWNKIEIYFGNTLSDAWIQARPNDKFKFDNANFKKSVDANNGKWLEKQEPSDSYKVILSKKNKEAEQLAKVLAHEIRHCLDFQAALKGENEIISKPGRYYSDWSEFRSVNISVRYDFFIKTNQLFNSYHWDMFKILSELLGYWSADCVEGLMKSSDKHDTMYFLCRYIGAMRAIRNLAMEYNFEAGAFHLWNMIPQYIIETFGTDVFYLANEWDEINCCQLNQKPGIYYTAIVEKLLKE